MKTPVFLSVLVVLSLSAPSPMIEAQAVPVQSEPVLTLISSNGQPIALILELDYSVPGQSLCFSFSGWACTTFSTSLSHPPSRLRM